MLVQIRNARSPRTHYDAWTWFQEFQWEHFWKDARLEQLPTRMIRAMQRDPERTEQYHSTETIRDKPWLRFGNGLWLPAPMIPIAGGADAPGVPITAWTPFGIQAPYTGAGADNATLTGAVTNQFQQYRDVTLSGTVTPASASTSPQIILARVINMAGNIVSANAAGAAAPGAGTNGVGAAGLGANGSPSIVITAAIIPASGVPYDPYQNLMANGGASGSGLGNNAVAGTAAATANLFAALCGYYMMIGCVGGGSGANGGGGTATGTQVAGGQRGGKGTVGGTTAAGGGGGSGVGGGSGGGNATASGGTTGGTGGAGGGILVVICDDIIGTAGTFRANGADGGAGTGTAPGGGGGGGGGVCLVFARHVTTTPTVQANGGAAGVAAGGDGAAGGAGLAQLVRST